MVGYLIASLWAGVWERDQFYHQPYFSLLWTPFWKIFDHLGVGLSINSFYVGGFRHADDIQTLATSKTSQMKQFNKVKLFAQKHHLKLNITKCDIVVLANRPRGADNLPMCDMDGVIVPSGDVGKCFGYWWNRDLIPSKSIEENINKAWQSFFHFGSISVFCGDISPLSLRSVLETCAMPIFHYGSENWILTESFMKTLESFQGELTKWILKWPKHLSSTAAIGLSGCTINAPQDFGVQAGFSSEAVEERRFCSSFTVWWFWWVLLGQRVQRP